MFDFRLPDLGKGLTEAEIVRWHVRRGQSVKENDVLVEVETDKASVAIPSPTDGTVISVYGTAGTAVHVGEVLVSIDDGNNVTIHTNTPVRRIVRPERLMVGVQPVRRGHRKRVLAAPATRWLARQLGVDLAIVNATGPQGRVTKDDVRRHGSMSSSFR